MKASFLIVIKVIKLIDVIKTSMFWHMKTVINCNTRIIVTSQILCSFYTVSILTFATKLKV